MAVITFRAVYVMEDNFGRIKIGISNSVETRLRKICDDSGLTNVRNYQSSYSINGSIIEKMAHKHFKEHHIKGEWFSAPFEDACDFVQKLDEETKSAIRDAREAP